MKTIEQIKYKIYRELVNDGLPSNSDNEKWINGIVQKAIDAVQGWIPFPSKEIPELNKDYLVKHNILGTEEIEIMTFRNTKEIGQVFTKIVSMGSMDGLQIYPVTHWRPIELK